MTSRTAYALFRLADATAFAGHCQLAWQAAVMQILLPGAHAQTARNIAEAALLDCEAAQANLAAAKALLEEALKVEPFDAGPPAPPEGAP